MLPEQAAKYSIIDYLLHIWNAKYAIRRRKFLILYDTHPSCLFILIYITDNIFLPLCKTPARRPFTDIYIILINSSLCHLMFPTPAGGKTPAAHPFLDGFSFCPSHSTYSAQPLVTYDLLAFQCIH